MKMKKALYIILTILLTVSSTIATNAQNKTYRIGVLLWHEPLHDEEALRGFKEGLELTSLPFELDVKRAYGNEANCRQFAQQWKAQKIDLICTIGTKGTLWTMEEVDDIPIVFTAVTNPVVSGIADSWQSSGRNVTGSSNWIHSEDLFKIFRGAVPTLKTLGVIYDPANPVPVAEVTEARDVCKSMGIVLKEAHVKNVNEIEKTIENLVDQGIDTLWVPREILAYNNLTHIGRATKPRNLPVVSSTMQAISSTEAVGIVAATVDYEALGRLCVPAAVEILTEGKNPNDIPIRTMSNYPIAINANAAESIGYKIPPIFFAKACHIISGYEGSKIVVAGTGDSQELLRLLARAFQQELGSGEIEVPDTIGSGGGIKALIAGKADLARVARPLKAKENSHDITYKVFAKSPIVFVVNPSITNVENLTTEQIISIYSGKITNWNEIDGQKGKIYAVTREPGDSSLSVLNETLEGFKDISDSKAKVIYNTPETVDTLINHRKTIGFLPISSVVGTQLKILKVDGVYPSAENVNSGKYKHIVPFGIVYKGELKGLAKTFVDFLYDDKAQKIITSLGTVPATGQVKVTTSGYYQEL